VPADYAVLAPIYNQIGMARFAETMTPRLIDYAQQRDWLGRRILDLGCGTGASFQWLSRYGYMMTGVDNAPQMLDIARQSLDNTGISLKWQQKDIRELDESVGTVDMALALDVINEMDALRDLEAVFKGAHRALGSNKLFIFDMYTIEGLTQAGLSSDSMVYDDQSSLAVFVHNEYDYERQMQTRHYSIFQRDGEAWRRQEATRILRAFPVQAVATLLQRSGFSIMAVLNPNFETFEPGVSRAPRVIFIAEKQ
jgi:SAM-dependent methyltransferase